MHLQPLGRAIPNRLLVPLLLSLLACATWAGSAAAADAPGRPASFDGTSVTLKPGEWNGDFSFPGVYCLRFPEPARATDRISGLINGGAVSMLKVVYDDPLYAFVVTSAMPPGRAASEDAAKRLVDERQKQQLVGDRLAQVETRDSAMGEVTVLHFRDVAPQRERELFPVDRPFYDHPGDRPLTLAESRIFSRGHDRYEVAALRAVPEDATAQQVVALRQRLNKLVDAMLSSIQQCTAGLPPRIEQP